MFIILSIYSKNLNSLTDFLKFFYKFKTNKIFKIKFCTVQSQQQRQFFFLSTLKSPHVNKKSREHFELRIHKRIIDILDPGAKTIDSLTTLNVPAGVDIRMVLD